VRITVDDEPPLSTKTVRGSKPEWTESFDILLKESSTIIVEVVHVTPSSKEVLRARAKLLAKDILSEDRDATLLSKHKLCYTGINLSLTGSLVLVSVRRKHEERPAEAPTIPDPANNHPAPPVLPLSTSTPPNMPYPPNIVSEAADSVPTVVERARTTMAGIKGYDGTTMDGITTVSSSDLCGTILGYVDKVVRLGDIISQVHPYAKLAWEALTVVHKVLKCQQDRDDRVRDLLSTIVDMLGFMEDVNAISKIQRIQDTVSCMMRQICECALFVHKYGERGLFGRVARDAVSTKTDDHINLFVKKFNELKDNFDRGTNVQTLIIVHGIEQDVRQLGSTLQEISTTEQEKLWDRLPGSDLSGVKFDQSLACLDGTRTKLLDDIRKWMDHPVRQRILWLSGGAGSGKSSVANSTAMLLDGIGCLGASFRFNRDTEGLNRPEFLFGNLCYQLVHFSKRLRSEALPVIDKMGYVGASSLQTQAKWLIVDTTNAAELGAPVVVVVDALDECGNKETRKNLLHAIATELPELPASVKFFITSRDEPDIRRCLQDCSEELRIDDAEGTADDIASYIQRRMGTIRSKAGLRSDWPNAEQLRDLRWHAGDLFIWASVACNFVEDGRRPVVQLNQLLAATSVVNEAAHSPLAQLDRLYGSILEAAFPDKNDDLKDVRYIIGTIVAVDEPCTQTGLDSLLGLGDEAGSGPVVLPGNHFIYPSSSKLIISSLGSILRTGMDGRVHLHHPSLYDFLTVRADPQFRIDLVKQKEILAFRCLVTMNNQLKFNICKIHDPALLKFLSEHLLHWMEAMSWLGQITETENSLRLLAVWMKDLRHGGANNPSIVDDAIPFLRNFGQTP